jgi:cytochrome c2
MAGLRIRSAAVAAILLAACEEAPLAQLRVAGGSAARGRVLAGDRGCGTCHVIPGVAGAVFWAGPPLSEWARRGWLAGRYPNTPEQLVAWLRDPQAFSPGSAMPDLGLNEVEARDIAGAGRRCRADRPGHVRAGRAPVKANVLYSTIRSD